MTLLISVLAAVVFTILWYTKPNKGLMLHVPCFMFWGASLMWFVDAMFEYAELGAEYFTPSAESMLNDAFLGVSVVVFALVIWAAIILIKDPNGRIKSALLKK